jgi:hypothetical protein
VRACPIHARILSAHASHRYRCSGKRCNNW